MYALTDIPLLDARALMMSPNVGDAVSYAYISMFRPSSVCMIRVFFPKHPIAPYAFGERIGVTRGSMSNIENGNRNLTEQMTKSICREFSVDYIWLTTGDGEMFVDTDDDFIERIDRIMVGEDDARKNLFKALLEASDEDIAAFQRIIDLFASKKD